jgi:hypothetical protein
MDPVTAAAEAVGATAKATGDIAQALAAITQAAVNAIPLVGNEIERHQKRAQPGHWVDFLLDARACLKHVKKLGRSDTIPRWIERHKNVFDNNRGVFVLFLGHLEAYTEAVGVELRKCNDALDDRLDGEAAAKMVFRLKVLLEPVPKRAIKKDKYLHDTLKVQDRLYREIVSRGAIYYFYEQPRPARVHWWQFWVEQATAGMADFELEDVATEEPSQEWLTKGE